MFVVTVAFELEPGREPEFMPLMLENAGLSLRDEPGCRVFDVCTNPERPEAIFLYEVYDDRAAFDAHLASAHFAAFDRATAPLVRGKTVSTWRRSPPA